MYLGIPGVTSFKAAPEQIFWSFSAESRSHFIKAAAAPAESYRKGKKQSVNMKSV